MMYTIFLWSLVAWAVILVYALVGRFWYHIGRRSEHITTDNGAEILGWLWLPALFFTIVYWACWFVFYTPWVFIAESIEGK